MTKALVLISGGLDSSLAFLKLVKQGYEVTPIFVDFNQYPAKQEWRAVEVICQVASEAFLDTKIHSPVALSLECGEERVASVWGRNIALVGLVAMYAYTHGNNFSHIALGLHEGDVGPDCKPGVFTEVLEQVLNISTKGELGLLLPIEHYTVADIGKELGPYLSNWYQVYSCYWDPPCGFRSKNDGYLCPGCRRKAVAMEAVGVQVPSLLSRPNCLVRTYQSPNAAPTGY